MATVNDNHIFIDLETKSEQDIKVGSYKYSKHKSTKILILSYCVGSGEVNTIDFNDELTLENKLEKFYSCINGNSIFIAHNYLFEIYILTNSTQINSSLFKDLDRWRCTMVMCLRSSLPAALDNCAKSLRLKNKMKEGKNLIRMFSIPPFCEPKKYKNDYNTFIGYCELDVLICRNVWVSLPEWKDQELKETLLDLISNYNGITVDTELCKIIKDNILKVQSSFSKEITNITRGNITATTQIQRIKSWMQRYVNKDIDSCDKENIGKILNGEFGEVDDRSMKILEMRRDSGKSSVSKFNRMIDSNVDDKIKGMIISFGAHTGRPISKLLNLYNLPKSSIEKFNMEELCGDLHQGDIEYIDNKYGPYILSASSAVRGMILPSPDKKLCVSDYSSIETRVVFWLSNCETGLDAFRNGRDLYKEAASHIFNVSYERVDDEKRWIGKQVILGACYGLGAQGFVNSCARWGKEVSLSLAKKAISSYREQYSEVVETWDELNSKAMLAINTGKPQFSNNGKFAFQKVTNRNGISFLYMKLPSGRLMTFPHCYVKEIENKWGGSSLQIHYRKYNEKGVMVETTYGGKLMENLSQAIARDIMYNGALNAKDKGYDILFTVYDEIIAEHEDPDIDEFNKLITESPSWCKDLPLLAEGKILTRYNKL